MKPYRIITYHPTHNGYDEKPEAATYSEAKADARRLLLEDNPNFCYCEKVFVLYGRTLKRVYDEHHHNGRKPYDFEIEMF